MTRVTVVDAIALSYLNLVGASVALTIIFKRSQRIQLRRTLQTSIVAAIPAASSQPIAMFIDSEINMPSSIAPTYADGEYYEDDKADMITQLMANHSGIVTSSLVLVERSNLITRVTCLSWHVPECVLFTVGTYHESETT